MKYLELRNKTIFDIGADIKSINQIVPLEDKDFFIEHITDIGRALTFLELAELTDDRELETATREQFREELLADE